MSAAQKKLGIENLLQIMRQLRDPQTGCPWDVKQTFASVAPYTIEEAYEVADAIDRNNTQDLCDELGDLLLQVVFHSRIAEEAGHFDFSDVVNAICNKMTRRHPHVFGGTPVADAKEQTRRWEAHKSAERNDDDSSVLAGISKGMPEWMRSHKLQKRAATVGFDWPDANPVLDKLHEEIDEVRQEFAATPRDKTKLLDEIGDVLFVCVNLARHANVDCGDALRFANRKFERRFRQMEAFAAAQDTNLSELDLEQQDALWKKAKLTERKPA